VCVCVFVCLCVQIEGKFVSAMGSHGAGLGHFSNPSGLAVSPDETRLVVVDMNNHRVVVADARDGRTLRTACQY
jgi:DNA-binding beta-propeller fold protein YncE